jgi:hypothetical protein
MDNANKNPKGARPVNNSKKLARAASLQRMNAAKAAAQAALAANRCPCCGRGVRRNSALTGWVQCSQFGAEGFRADSSQPSCDWQGFTA